MTAAELPPDLTAALTRLTHSVSRSDLAKRAAAISETYRGGGGSQSIVDADDALAYALARMPATYAAVAACLAATRDARPGFAPSSLLDVGAGPGTATWAAAQAFPALSDLAMLDTNSALRDLALALAQDNPRLRTMHYKQGEARKLLASADQADLVIASYLIGELDQSERSVLADLMWARTRDTLLIVEPGTPAGYARMIALRARLTAAGAHVIAPCPHDRDCPLVAPDWCHFAQRLPRSRDHKQVKGVELPFEDEKFSYVALSREPLPQPPSRVLAQPTTSKVEIVAKLCRPDGVHIVSIPRRERDSHAKARRWRWGDAVRDAQGIS